MYPALPSVAAGETLELCVRTVAKGFRVVVTRVGSAVERAFASETLHAEDEAWASYPLRIPADARPGAYVARCLASDEVWQTAQDFDARSNAALFIVRPPRRRAPIVFNIPLFTYHAYNCDVVDPHENETTGRSLYTGAKSVTLRRPGGGIGGHLWDERNVDVYDRATPRQSFAHWDARALAWLEREGYDAECVTDYDLHAQETLLEGRRLLVCFGHHEYWTDTMRALTEAFVARGGNVAFFGANALWFRIRFDPQSLSIARAGAWPAGEEAVTGASYRFGGGKWIGERPALGYSVRDAEHWAFAGCGFSRGSTFGAAGRLIGYECDGVSDGDAGGPGPTEIARAELRAWDVADGSGEVFPHGHASFAVRAARGTVVHAGTVDWPRLLGIDPSVTRITQNVIARCTT